MYAKLKKCTADEYRGTVEYPFTHHPLSFDWNGCSLSWQKFGTWFWKRGCWRFEVNILMANISLKNIVFECKCHSYKGRFPLNEVQLRFEFQPPFALFLQFSSKLLKLLVVWRPHLVHSLFQWRQLKCKDKIFHYDAFWYQPSWWATRIKIFHSHIVKHYVFRPYFTLVAFLAEIWKIQVSKCKNLLEWTKKICRGISWSPEMQFCK